MKQIILVLILIFSCSVVEAQTLTSDDKTFIKTTRLIRSLETQLSVKQEEMRIAVSALRTTFKADMDAIELQIRNAEETMEALN